MAQETGENKEQSMEEILQSIKRIIAEENDGSEDDASDSAPSPISNGVHGSDVLELTDLVEEGDAPASPAPAPAPVKAAASSGDILDSIDNLLSDDAARSSAAALRQLSGSPKPRSSGGALPTFRSGTTVEDLMIEAMKPMLKEWLDAHLPGLVERLVEREIRKLSN